MKPIFSTIPTRPGVYRYYDPAKRIIYIGKAKNLRNRIRSYWAREEDLAPDKRVLVSEIADLEYTVLGSEREALLLEAALIKKHQPKYNIVLRDDKNWTYIVVQREPFPRVVTVHGRTKRNGEHFGPYTSGRTARNMVRLIHKLLPLRTCSRDLSKLPNGLVCMQYHLGNCLGPCAKFIDAARYDQLIVDAKAILRGEGRAVVEQLKRDMASFSRTRHFEAAAAARNKIRAYEATFEKQNVVQSLSHSYDALGCVIVEREAQITVLQVRHGQLQDTLHYPLRNELQVRTSEVLDHFLIQHYGSISQPPREIILPTIPSKIVTQSLAPIRLMVPSRGFKRKTLELAQTNAWLHYQRTKQQKPLPEQLYRLKELLDLPAVPRRIEAYDISNMQGSHAVGALVVALDGVLSPSQYRTFTIKGVTGSNDVAMLKEVLTRRQRHASWGEPDLIVLDGGKPQLNTVYPILPAAWKAKVVALAKQQEELFLPGRARSIDLPLSDPALLLLRKIRDAVHSKAIRTYRARHRRSSRGDHR